MAEERRQNRASPRSAAKNGRERHIIEAPGKQYEHAMRKRGDDPFKDSTIDAPVYDAKKKKLTRPTKKNTPKSWRSENIGSL
jgi:hypothetical protein